MPALAVNTSSNLYVLVAFGGGVISFLSPCVLPIVPGYLSLITGL
ncbi:MAG: cytochrome c biogenesis protein CcdA, partial [Acidimicrobiia bacterium]